MAIRNAKHADQDIQEAFLNLESNHVYVGGFDTMPSFEECKEHAPDWFYYPTQDALQTWDMCAIEFVSGTPLSLVASTGCAHTTRCAFAYNF